MTTGGPPGGVLVVGGVVGTIGGTGEVGPASGATTAVAFDCAVLLPALFVVCTWKRSVVPTSAAPSV